MQIPNKQSSCSANQFQFQSLCVEFSMGDKKVLSIERLTQNLLFKNFSSAREKFEQLSLTSYPHVTFFIKFPYSIRQVFI